MQEPALRPYGDVSTLASVMGGEVVCGDGAQWIDEISTDSRRDVGPCAMFVALRGARFDGHDHVFDMIARGVRVVIVEHVWWDNSSLDPDVLEMCVVCVHDTLRALQALAAWWRARWGGVIVAITGSNGKTTTKELLASVLAHAKQTVHRSPGSYNSQVGVALALLGLRAAHDIAVIEAGISQPGEMGRLRAMIRPDHGILTNVGLAHAAGLPTLALTAREKLTLFAREEGGDDVTDTRVLVTHAALAPFFSHLPIEERALWRLVDVRDEGDDLSHGGAGGVGAGHAEESDAVHGDHGEEVEQFLAVDVVLAARRGGAGWSFHLPVEEGAAPRTVQLRSIAPHDVQNAALVASMARQLGCAPDAIVEGLHAAIPAPMRLEVHTTPRGITLINDAYSADPTSARAALAALEQHAGAQRAIAIVGDMLDLGALSEQEHRELGRFIAERGHIARLICLGDEAAWIRRGAIDAGFSPERVDHCDDTDALHALLDRVLRPDDVVLFKASRAVRLDRAVARLMESMGPTRLFIDLNAIRDNFHALRAHVDPGAKLMAVVKSFAYGSDSTRVSLMLAAEGVDALAIAYADEGEELRRAGITTPIMVLNTLAEEADKVVRAGLTGVIYSEHVARALHERAIEADVPAVDVHIKIDTGMHRVGVSLDELDALLRRLPALDRVRVRGVMTHLAAADDPMEDAYTREQLKTFRRALEIFHKHGVSPGIVHAANTAGAWRFPDATFDLVRVGMGLYGLSLDDGVYTRNTRCAMRFVTRILHVKTVPAGATVGYGRAWRATQPSVIATIAAGYNDGLPRFMSCGGEVLVHGRRCPIVGRVCMDASMIDVTHLDRTPDVGDEVVIFGEQDGAFIAPGELAARGGTIHYEILCSISPRVRRIFTDSR